MKKQLVILGIVALLMIVGLSGCINNPFDTERNKFIGTWKGINDADVATFFSDGTCSLGAGILSGGGNWEIKDGKLVLSVNNYIIMALSYSFSNNNNDLTLTQQGGGMSSTYYKQLS